MWYAGILATDEAGKQRLIRELDFLKAHGVTNIRVMARAEGMGMINGANRVEPALQPTKDSINESLMEAFDFFLAEAGKRKIYSVIFLSNNWEWSGGFLQYLNWNGKLTDERMRKPMEWEQMRDDVSKFYSCEGCKNMYFDAVRDFLKRKNSITGIAYTEDPFIMAWEIANEPRPMRPSAIPAYKQFLHDAAALIHSLDNNHLVTTGSEGVIGSENEKTFVEVHSDPLIDYATMHIWPKNWQWFSDTSIAVSKDKIEKNTLAYLRQHDSIMQFLNKPLVLEEFGMPRDGESLDTKSTYHYRQEYFEFITGKIFFNRRPVVPTIAGINFWAYGGEAKPVPGQRMWKKGNALMGDPPFEPQGLNTVFNSDAEIWNLVMIINSRLESEHDY